MHCGTVCGYEVRVNEMIGIEEMTKTVTDKLQNSIETAVQVVSVTTNKCSV
jgi:HrpA-like RNA helicase